MLRRGEGRGKRLVDRLLDNGLQDDQGGKDDGRTRIGKKIAQQEGASPSHPMKG